MRETPIRTPGWHPRRGPVQTRPTATAARAALVALLAAAPVMAQQTPWTPTSRGSDNIDVLGHLPLGPRLSVADMDVEQEMDRPYAYVARMVYGDEGP